MEELEKMPEGVQEIETNDCENASASNCCGWGMVWD
jgi:hypothetical protein